MRPEQVLRLVRRNPLRLALYATLATVVALLVPMAEQIQLGPVLSILHIPMFALLVLLWMHALTRERMGTLAAVTACLAVGAALAVGTEAMQYWIPGRWPSVADVVRNLLGLMLGISLFFWLGLDRGDG